MNLQFPHLTLQMKFSLDLKLLSKSKCENAPDIEKTAENERNVEINGEKLKVFFAKSMIVCSCIYEENLRKN